VLFKGIGLRDPQLVTPMDDFASSAIFAVIFLRFSALAATKQH